MNSQPTVFNTQLSATKRMEDNSSRADGNCSLAGISWVGVVGVGGVAVVVCSNCLLEEEEVRAWMKGFKISVGEEEEEEGKKEAACIGPSSISPLLESGVESCFLNLGCNFFFFGGGNGFLFLALAGGAASGGCIVRIGHYLQVCHVLLVKQGSFS